jgi:hypothetical protein
MNHIANLAAVPALVRRALRRSLQRIAAALRLASRLAAVVVLATYQRAAVTAWRWHRVAVIAVHQRMSSGGAGTADAGRISRSGASTTAFERLRRWVIAA